MLSVRRLLPLCLLPFAAVFASLAPAAPATPTPDAKPPFAHLASDLPVDPAVKFGQLPNGVRYAVLANAEPRERAALRLYIDAGSLQETDDQRGLAHFLEHMAFNGSENYAPGTLVEFFQRMGMNFGGDTNAYTSFDRTVYMVDLPHTDMPTVTEGLGVLRDFAGGLLLPADEIDRERGIILSEKRDRDSVEWRSFLAEYEFVLGDTRFPQRLPIGVAEVIEQAGRDRFTAFYDTWYRPDRIAVVAVGDFDADAVVAQIADIFGPLEARAPAAPEPDLGQLPAFDGIRILYHHEPEGGSTTVGIQAIEPISAEPDTAANRVRDLPLSLATAILNRRLAELAKKEGAPFSSGRASASEGFDFYRNPSIELTCQPDQWSAALAVADHELRRALEHGFQAPELREVAASMRNALEQAVATAPTRRSPNLAAQLISALADDEVFTTPQTELALFGPALDAITPEIVLAAFRDAWAPGGRFITVIGNAALPPVSAEAKIRAIYETAHAAPVAPPAKIDETPFAYTDFGPAGEIVSRTHVEDLNITQVVFANGVRLNLKPTDFEAGRLLMRARVGGGQLTEPRSPVGLGTYANSTFIAGGLGQHSSDDLRRLLAGRNVGVGFSVGDDAFEFSGGTTPDDLLLQLQLTAAYLTDPGYRPEADRQIQKIIEQYYARLAHVPDGPLQLEIPRLLAGGDPRFALPPQADLAARTLDELRAWLTPALRHDAIEVSLVGDFDPEAAIAAVAQTLGALPPREPKPAYTDARHLDLPDAPFAKDYAVPTEIPKGVVALYWPTTDGRDAPTARRLTTLGNVLADRLRVKVREELANAYSPGAGSQASSTYEDYGYMLARVTVDPAQADAVADVVRDLAADLAAQGATADELDRAKQPVLTSLRESARTNGYWIGAVLGSAQEEPQRLDWARSRYADTESITLEEINALAAAYLKPESMSRFIILPETAPTP